MAIVISGVNNNDKITASDGTIDLLSGVNYAGIITAPAFTSTGNITAASINVGSGIQVGNAGIITATTLIGNVTGNINHTSNLLLQISGSEKFRVGTSGQLGIGGANYGSAGQVLTSGGSGSAATWSTIASDKITEGNTEAEVVDTGSDGHFKVTTEGTERFRITPNGIVNIGDGITNEYLNSTLKIRKDQNSVTRVTIRNENSGSGSAAAFQIGASGNSWMLQCGSNANDSNAFTIRVDGTANSNTGTERFRLTTAGAIGLNGANYGSSGQVLTSSGSGSAVTWSTITGTTINNNANDRVITGSASANTLEAEANLTFETATSGGTLTVAGTSEYQIKLKDSNTSGNGAETALAFTDSGNTVQGFVGYNYWGDGNIDLQNNNSGGSVCINTGGGNERLVVTSDGDIYGPSGGRKNWFDNGSFDCTYGGHKANTSMDYGNHHAYGWVTDRFMSRNSVQWSRSTNVPTGKGFSYSTLTNGAGGQIMQAVELPDYGDMGVFTPGSYWCVSFWSTAGANASTTAFSYDLGSTKTDIPGVGSGTYATTGETASGTSTGTFNRYYRVFGPMPSSIISGATSAYWTWYFSAAGYTTGFQLERVPTSTSKPTPYEHVHPSVTIARCRRYCFRLENTRLMNGYKRNDTEIYWHVNTPVPYTHMPAGSNQNVSPLGAYAISTGLLTNFQSQLQNPAITSQSMHIFEYSPASSSFLLRGNTSWSSTHAIAPSWEGMEVEFGHGHF